MNKPAVITVCFNHGIEKSQDLQVHTSIYYTVSNLIYVTATIYNKANQYSRDQPSIHKTAHHIYVSNDNIVSNL